MSRKTAKNKTSAAKREAKRQEEIAAQTTVTVPLAVFEKVMNVLAALPYGQVAGVITEVSQSVQYGVREEIDDPASGDEETE